MIDDSELPTSGITLLPDGRARWCVWAPVAKAVELILNPGDEARLHPMIPAGHGFFEAVTERPERGTRYVYRLDGEPPLPDPVSRWQPEGIRTPSAVWWPDEFKWDDCGWKGPERSTLVFYELHVGTFTPEGTFDAAEARIEDLLEIGITAIELMPVAQFSGRRSWGYDGVHPFAVQNSYGGPDGLQRFVNVCHRRGMAVFLDVVYNHLGPEGNVFPRFGNYVTDRYRTDWGPALNFDGRGCDAVRALVLDNARQWIRDFHLDGLRLDAADQIYDRSPTSILTEIAQLVHEEGKRLDRRVHVFAETDLNDAPRFLHPRSRGGYGLDGYWNDDFHHAVHVTLSGETNGYYVDYSDGPRALRKAFERVFVNDGNYSAFRGRRHGTEAVEFPGDRFLAFTQNHDQVGNRLKSDRNATLLPPPAVRLAAGLLLLAPRIPLIFMGEEYGETRPFPFFCDYHDPELVRAVREGRKAEFAYFGWEADIPDPVAESTRDSAILSWEWGEPFRKGLRRLYADLLRLRRTVPALRDFSAPETELHEEPGRCPILEVRRGVGPVALRIYFNLGPEDRPNPLATTGCSYAFRSEAEPYVVESGRTEGPSPGCLRPWEFAIVGTI